jgi:Transglutaminase-like superfamily
MRNVLCLESSVREDFGLSRQETALLKTLRTPEKIQRFLDEEVRYNKEPAGPTCRSPRRVLRDRVAHCIEGAMLAAAALRVQGLPPLILDMEAARDDDHLLALFRYQGYWGAVAKSNYSGLRFRDPVFRNIRELVLSYYELYYNLEGEKSLSAYSRPVNLSRFDPIGWMTAEEELWEINDYLCAIPHTPVRPPGLRGKRLRVDKRLYDAGLLGSIQ